MIFSKQNLSCDAEVADSTFQNIIITVSRAYEDDLCKVGFDWYQDPLLEVPPGSAHSATEVAACGAVRGPGAKKTTKKHSKTAPLCSARPL